MDGAIVSYDYDTSGLFTAIRGPGDYYCGFKYDAAHRLIALLTPMGQAFGNPRADARIREFIALANAAMDAAPAGPTGRSRSLDALVAQATPTLELLQTVRRESS